MWIYLIVGLITMSSFQLIGGNNVGLSRTKSVFVGGSVTSISTQWFTTYTSTESYLRACYSGGFGWSGQFMLAGLLALITVMIYNLVSTRRYLVV